MILFSGGMKTSRPFGRYLLCVLLVLGCAAENDYPDSIMLFIGDSMGVAHISAGWIAAGTLNLERFSVGGFVTTHSANRLVTESAATASALATGKKPTTGLLR